MGAPGQRQELNPVLEAEGHVVPKPESEATEKVGNATGLLVEFGKRHSLARASHDDGGAIRVLGGPVARVLSQLWCGGGDGVAHNVGPYR